MIEDEQRYKWRAIALGVLLLALLFAAVRDIVRSQASSNQAAPPASGAN